MPHHETSRDVRPDNNDNLLGPEFVMLLPTALHRRSWKCAPTATKPHRVAAGHRGAAQMPYGRTPVGTIRGSGRLPDFTKATPNSTSRERARSAAPFSEQLEENPGAEPKTRAPVRKRTARTIGDVLSDS